MRSRLLVLIPILLLVVAACGDDGGSAFSSSTASTAATDASTTTAAASNTTGDATTSATGAAAGDADDLVEALAAQLAVPGTPFDDEAAECFARGVVDEIGFDRLAALGAGAPGADPEEVFSQMSEAEIDAIADLGLACLDLHALFVDQFVSQGLPRDAAICIADGVAGAPFLHDMVVQAMLGGDVDPMEDPEAMALIMDLVTQCMSG